jgi:hypothetical protein
MEESLGAVPLEALHKFRCGSSDDLESEIGGFALEIVNLQFAMLSIVKLRSSVDEVHSVAQTVNKLQKTAGIGFDNGFHHQLATATRHTAPAYVAQPEWLRPSLQPSTLSAGAPSGPSNFATKWG